ncbi:ceramide transfer protein isoform X1 [Amyelois transitella]|uniref:ceramide transfer protein isoform X1 n=1 Tax=Amyelois transitella TaxID=680683 RepID=UPI00299048F3|nr:ceramide transfer protein isoform X1 [Amyelois transitella]XP_060805572.1 ceramide transfer protein isoform X1 [Amyelois transitella]
MTEETITVSDNSDSDEGGAQELRGHLSKWTNYIHGWQDRFIVLKDSTLSYYKSELESNLGCRGALCLKKAKVKPHEFDDCRFDVSVNDCVWYLRASNPEEKQQWIDVLESFKVESGYGTSSDSSSNGGGLRRHGSVTSLQSTGSHVWKRAFWAADGTRTPSPTDVRSRADSTESYGRTARRLTEKIQELDTYSELLSKQAVQLTQYFDMCVASYPQINDEGIENEAIDAVKLADGNDLSLHAGEVRGTSASFRATIGATMATLSHCAELLRRREKQARQAEELYMALKTQLNEARLASKPGPDHEEGPHSTLPDDEFYDAVETGFDKMEEERCARVAPPIEHTRDQVDLPPPAIDNRLTVHPLWPEIDRISTEQIQAAFEGVGGEIGWQLFAEEGDMRMYRREMEVDGMVMDPLKAMHKVRGVSAREMCHYFFNPRYRYEWETTLENMTIVEEISSDALVFHQSFKRIWPASQRDALFWSHVRAASGNTYAVTNHSTTNTQYPANTGACIRLFVTVCLACRSSFPAGETPSRDNITTSIAYCSTVNPGGWAPAGVLRAVYKREYPKFLKRFTGYVAEQCRGKPLAI